MVRKILWFTGLYALLLVGTAVMVTALGGSVWDPTLGWAEGGGTAALLVVIIVAWALATFGRFERATAMTVTAGGVALTLAIGLLGLLWLAEPIKTVLKSTTFWWLLGTGALTVAAWLWPRRSLDSPASPERR